VHVYVARVSNKFCSYVVFAVSGQSPLQHIVSIERMTPDKTLSSLVNVSGFFPVEFVLRVNHFFCTAVLCAPCNQPMQDDYVESPALFKRAGIYYVTYGSCCCGCKGGGGIVVFTSRSIYGPWTRQVSAAWL
jgi:hypothetical protein